MHFFVREDLIQLGCNEDGEPVIGSRFYVVAESINGRRFAHEHGFWDRVLRVDEDGDAYYARVDGADQLAEALRSRIEAHVAAGGRLNEAHWNEIDPCYGSEAYQKVEATGFFRDRERQEDERW